MRVSLLGGGAMGEAIIAALVSGDAPVAQPQDVRVFDVVVSRISYLASEYGVRAATTPADLLDTDFLLL